MKNARGSIQRLALCCNVVSEFELTSRNSTLFHVACIVEFLYALWRDSKQLTRWSIPLSTASIQGGNTRVHRLRLNSLEASVNVQNLEKKSQREKRARNDTCGSHKKREARELHVTSLMLRHHWKDTRLSVIQFLHVSFAKKWQEEINSRLWNATMKMRLTKMSSLLKLIKENYKRHFHAAEMRETFPQKTILEIPTLTCSCY